MQPICEVSTESQYSSKRGLESVQSPARAFSGGIEATPVTGKYKLGLVLAASAMVLLFAIYFGIILLVGYGVYQHLTHFSQIMSAASNDSFTLFGALFLPVSGLIIVFFLIKPFLAGRAPEPDRYTLTRQSDPQLFAVIDKVCELVKAPQPSRVDVDCQVNASAHFRNGWRGMKNNDVVLTIGLPLAANLTMQEFVGVLAHEFGHFTQSAGMRLTYIIRTTNQWFARVVYARDQWDVWLMRAARVHMYVAVVMFLTQFCIWLSRRVLWMLMYAGHFVSGFMLRQMEFDADSYEVKVSGSAAFARGMTKIRELNAASLWAHMKMKESWQARKLPEDVVRFINSCLKSVPPALQTKSDAVVAKEKTGMFDTHPCPKARIAAAMAMNMPGVFHRTEPASQLFNGFDALCKGATRFHYESNLELRLKDNSLVPNECTERQTQSLEQAESALRDFFYGLRLKFRPIRISMGELESATKTELMQRVRDARKAMEQSAPEAKKANRDYEQAESLYQRGLDALKNASQTATTQAESVMATLAPTLAMFEGHAQTRLAGALRLLRDAEVGGKIKDVESLRGEADRLMVVFQEFGEMFVPLQELRRKSQALTAAVQARRQPSMAMAAQARREQLEPELRQMLAALKVRLQKVPYPFNDLRANMTLEDFAQSEVPENQLLGVLYSNCSGYPHRLLPLYQRVLGRLCLIALTVEQSLGLA